jgi:hypothetical protein
MLELSLQPTNMRARTVGRFIRGIIASVGRPIALDVLGIAPIDRLRAYLAWASGNHFRVGSGSGRSRL